MKWVLRLKLLALSMWLGTALSSCSSLPEYAKPQLYITESGSAYASRQGFGYRKLAVADFKAASLSAESRQYAHHLRARSCITIRPDNNVKILVNKTFIQGKPVYVGSLDHIAFHAVFIPDCSWWNPAVPADKKAYVLQHEQIHFALTELTAGKATRKAKEELQTDIAFGRTPEDVEKELSQKVKDIVQKAMNDDLRNHAAFDEDTSARFDPKAQQRWWNDTAGRLAEKPSDRSD